MSKVSLLSSGQTPAFYGSEDLSVISCICERITSIWKAVYAWICAWFSCTPSLQQSESELSGRSPKAFQLIMGYLEPKEIAPLEQVCKSWKRTICSEDQAVWKFQYKMQEAEQDLDRGIYKDAFANPNPRMAFGPKEWINFYGKPGPVPRLPSTIHKTIATRKDPFSLTDKVLRDNYTLTLVPATVDQKPLTLVHLKDLAERPRNMGNPMTFEIDKAIMEQIAAKPLTKSVWVFMRKDPFGSLEEDFAGSQKIDGYNFVGLKNEVESRGFQVGEALWIVASILGAYVRFGERVTYWEALPSWTSSRSIEKIVMPNDNMGTPDIRGADVRDKLLIEYCSQVTPSINSCRSVAPVLVVR